jgi:DNA-binding transcriptional ArsR family regulator
MATGKIEKLGLVKRIEDLIAQGTCSSEAISTALKTEGFNVSQPTISRYLKRTREERREETQKILSDHVQAHVPGDLTALETMEAQCLEWAHEDNDVFAHRLAGRNIADRLDEWVGLILSANVAAHTDQESLENARHLAVKEIMTQCIGFVSDDFAIQRARLLAMQRATGIIEMKLRYAGIIDSAKEGNVYILGSEDRLEKDDTSGRFIVIKGGRD